jgi:DHA2 family multidrug resistance protein
MDIYNPKFAARWNELVAGFSAKGFSLEQAQNMAAKAMDGMVIKNTYLLTYLDAFWATGIFLVVSIPLIWLQKSKKNAPVPVDSH